MTTENYALGHPNASTTEFERVLGALSHSLSVKLIMSTGMVCCSEDDSIENVLEKNLKKGYSQFPVRKDGKIIGVLVRDGGQADSGPFVRDRMKPLSEGDMVAADLCIGSYLECSVTQPYHLVIQEDKIVGIVTKSDLLKLPVRVYIFTLLSHLETSMLEFIREKLSETDWIKALSPGRQKKLNCEWNRVQGKDLQIEKIYYTQWSDKRDIIKKLHLKGEPQRSFVSNLKDLEKLRNNIVHANEYLENPTHLLDMCRRSEHWIEYLEKNKL